MSISCLAVLVVETGKSMSWSQSMIGPLYISRWCNFMRIETCFLGKFGNTSPSKDELTGMVEKQPYSHDSLNSTCFAFVYYIYIYKYIFGYDKVKIRKTKKQTSIFDPSTNDQHDQLSFRSLQPFDERRSENSSPGSWADPKNRIIHMPVSGTNYNGRHIPSNYRQKTTRSKKKLLHYGSIWVHHRNNLVMLI